MPILMLALAFPAGSPLADVKVREVLPRVYHLDFPTKRRLAQTFLRFQEHYESPRYKGEVFTAREFLAWYATTEKGKKSSYFDWDGFNVPSSAFAPFYAGKFDPLSPEEKALLELFRGEKDFYVIATSGKDSAAGTLRHELAHALFFLDAGYRRETKAILAATDLKEVRAMLERLGYHRDVWEDEAQAWLGDPDEDLAAEGLDPAPYHKTRKQLLAAYERYFGSRSAPMKRISPVSPSSIR